jgi:hypothetical protein
MNLSNCPSENKRILAMKKAHGMTTRLTLTIDDQVIQSAKKDARENGKSLSNLVEFF